MVHMGWILTKCGLVESRWWTVNQYALCVSWVVIRLGCDVALWAYVAANAVEILYGPKIQLLISVGGLAILSILLNPFWLKAKFRQLEQRNAQLQSKQRQ